MLINIMKARLKDKFVSIIVDGASTTFLRRRKITVILLHNSDFKRPLLVGIAYDEAGSTAEALALTIRRILKSYDVSLRTHVTALMGDNVTMNDKLARLLRLPCLKCISHALHLVFKAITKSFPSTRSSCWALAGS